MTERTLDVTVVKRDTGTETPTTPYDYGLPVAADSPWPLFRRDRRNTGRSPIHAKYHGDNPWSFPTPKGIFSTPVIGGDGTVYVGSADHYFYALNRDGSLKWRFETGELVDSAAALHDDGTVTFISGDGLMYHLRADDAADPSDRLVWTFDAASEPGKGYINWWEGNVAVGPDGALYAGNTNWNYYAISPDGAVRWKYPTASNCWSMACFDDDGTILWGGLDTVIRAVTPDGKERWRRRTWGMVAASAALGSDGTLYIGSFDTYLYALDARSGKTKWSYKTGDHIYGSAALGAGVNGETNAIYVGSTDGILCALSPRGDLLWKYDTGDPIRSSPAVGPAPEGVHGDVVYFGCGNGKLYALNARDGTRRWSFDTTPDEPVLRDRNDLNASPALGATGVYIAGEHGRVWYVPYDYPLHVSDPRCSTDAGEDLANDVVELYSVSPGGTTLQEAAEEIPAAPVLTYRLIVREAGQTVDARIKSRGLRVGVEPPFPFTAEPSADGHYLHIVPDDFLEPGVDYAMTVEGRYYTDAWKFGNLAVGGHRAGRFARTFSLRVAATQTPRFPLAVHEDHVDALEWTRLAVPIPVMMPSLNQIGFDYADCILAPILLEEPDSSGEGKGVFWLVTARRNDDGTLVASPDPDLMTPLNGVYRGDHFILRVRDATISALGVALPLNRLEFRGQLGADGVAKQGASAYADSRALSIPDYGPLLVLSGLANNLYKKLVLAGTFMTRPYDGPATRRPPEHKVSVTSVTYEPPTRRTPGRVLAQFEVAEGASYPLAAHRPAICLVNAGATEAVAMDYLSNLTATADAAGNLAAVALTIPPGTAMPANAHAIIVLDAFPLHKGKLQSGAV